MSESKRMYMHRLDGRPASFAWIREKRGGVIVNVPYIHFVGGRQPATLVPSLARLRREQRLAIRDATSLGQSEWANPKRYDHVAVLVPRV